MKKTFLKTAFIVLCVGVIIFLLLPFLETTAPSSSSLNAGQAQIVTENPLNAIARRLASLFKRPKEKAGKTLSQPTTAVNDSVVAQAPGRYAPQGQISTENQAAAKTSSFQTVALPPSTQPFDYEDASFQADNGEWVLVQQTAPAHSAPGMHEVNVHDNPYDRYVRQERARHFAPQTTKQEIPDSKWARLLHPIKTFLGLESARPSSSASLRAHEGDDKAFSLETAQDKLGTNNNGGSLAYAARSPLPGLSLQQWAQLTPEERQAYQERQAARDFADLLSGDRAAREAAEIMADIQFPNPKNDQEKQEKETFIQRLTEENKKRIKEGVMASIEKNAEDYEYKDVMPDMVDGCNGSLPGPCSGFLKEHLPQQDIENIQAINAKQFFESTKYVFPKNLPLTVIMGPTNRETFEKMLTDEKTKPVGEIYDFMYQTQKCDEQSCYLVANSKQEDLRQIDAVTMANASSKGDPLHVHQTFREAFVENKVNQLGPDVSPKEIEQVRKEALEQFDRNTPSYVFYVDSQMTQLHQNMLAAVDPKNPQANLDDLAVPFFNDPETALKYSKLVDSPIFAYRQDNPYAPFDESINTSMEMNNAMAQNVNDAKEVINQVRQESVSAGVSRSVKGMQDNINRAINQFNKGGANWGDLLNIFNKKSTKK